MTDELRETLYDLEAERLRYSDLRSMVVWLVYNARWYERPYWRRMLRRALQQADARGLRDHLGPPPH